ncbi:MAG: hypothetical protein AAF673_04080 [Pseudomonadota bacterium]
MHFCKSDAWKEKGSEAVIADFIAAASKSRPHSIHKVNTATMQKMISMLNEPATPTSIKSDFAKVLGVEIKQSTGQSRNDALLKFKFEPEHFSEITKERNDSKKTQASKFAKSSPTSLKRKRKDSIGDILKNPPKKSKTDQVIAELSKKQSEKQTR